MLRILLGGLRPLEETGLALEHEGKSFALELGRFELALLRPVEGAGSGPDPILSGGECRSVECHH